MKIIIIIIIIIMTIIIILLLLLKNAGSARLRESDIQPISPKTPAPQTNLQTKRIERQKL